MAFEQAYVHDVYTNIAHQFDATRHSKWKCVTEYLNSVVPSPLIIDIGSGNGKYINTRTDVVRYICIDTCPELLDIAREKAKGSTLYARVSYILASGCKIPVGDQLADSIISIAVLHHVHDIADRVRFIEEIARILKHNATALITVWSREQDIPSTWKELDTEGDFMIPWFNKSSKQYLSRYYHLYKHDEILELIATASNVLHITQIYSECNNWIVQLKKNDTLSK